MGHLQNRIRHDLLWRRECARFGIRRCFDKVGGPVLGVGGQCAGARLANCLDDQLAGRAWRRADIVCDGSVVGPGRRCVVGANKR